MKLVRCRYVNNCIFYTFIKLIVRNLKKDFTKKDFTDKNNQKVANKIEELIIKAIGHIRLMLANMCMCLFVAYRIPFSSWKVPCVVRKEKCLVIYVNTRTY